MNNPIANSDQFAAEREVSEMRVTPQAEQARAAIAGVYATGFGDRIGDADRAELQQFADEYLNNWLFKAAACDGQYPRFVRDFMPGYNWDGREVPGARTGGDNPDNVYRVSGIEHGRQYRVTGQLIGSAPANVSFTLHGNFGTSQTIYTIESHELICEADGRFVITIDDKPASGRPNHMTTGPRVKFLFVRDSMMNWGSETPLDLKIEMIGEPSRCQLTMHEKLDVGIFRAMDDFHLYFWFQNTFSGLAPNSVTPAEGAASGGLQTQYSSRGNFELGEHDAAIITVNRANALYASAQLGTWLFQSLDYHLIQSSLTQSQADIDDDGLCRMVIARRDPGCANWLDTGGRARAFFFYRWQGIRCGGEKPDLTLEMTTIDKLKDKLPANTRWLCADERKTALALRHAEYARRVTA